MRIFDSIYKFFYTSFFTVLDRYFYTQLFSNYLIGVSFFSTITMINELYYIIRLYFEQNVPFVQVMSLYVACLPYLFSFCIPFGILPAYLLLLGRLSQESELVSMRACGISQFRIMLPGIVFAIMVMFSAFAFREFIEIDSNKYYYQLRSKILSQKPVVQLLDNVFMDIGSVQINFSRSAKTDEGVDVLYNVYAVDVQNRRTIRAREARIYVNPDNPEHYIIKFFSGDLNQISKKKKKQSQGQISKEENPVQKNSEKEEFYLSSFGSMTMHHYIWLQSNFFDDQPTAKKFGSLYSKIHDKKTQKYLWDQFYEYKVKKAKIDDLIFMLKYFRFLIFARADDKQDQETIREFLDTNLMTLKDFQNNLRIQLHSSRGRLPVGELTNLYERLAMPVAAFVFAILCLPLGMFSARSGRGEGLSLSLVVVLVFFGFKSGLENMIIQNKIPPEYIWLPTLTFGIIASILFVRKVME